jgi:hypothetical protein
LRWNFIRHGQIIDFESIIGLRVGSLLHREPMAREPLTNDNHRPSSCAIIKLARRRGERFDPNF